MHRNGTATLAGKPSHAALGSYNFSVAAKNEFGTSSQTFTLVVGAIPSFSSSNSTTFPVGVSTVFHVTAPGSPQPTLDERGKLPTGVQFQGGRGIGTISGTPARGTSGSYQITLMAGEGAALSATQTFTLVVGAVPTFRSADKRDVRGSRRDGIHRGGQGQSGAKRHRARRIARRCALPGWKRDWNPLRHASQGYERDLPRHAQAGSGFASSASQTFTLIVSGG